LKAALQLVGCDVGLPRPPLMPVPEAALMALREALGSFEEVAVMFYLVRLTREAEVSGVLK
jgi:dihydrodipicolinate synthase/N-acetylneuraminate lyase